MAIKNISGTTLGSGWAGVAARMKAVRTQRQVPTFIPGALTPVTSKQVITDQPLDMGRVGLAVGGVTVVSVIIYKMMKKKGRR